MEVNSRTEESNVLKFVQINLQRARAATAQLVQYAMEEEADFLLIQEPFLYAGQAAEFPLQWTVIQDSGSEGTRAAVVCCHSRWLPVVLAKSRDMVTIAVEAMGLSVLVTNVYIPPTVDVSPTLDALQNILTSYPHAHHVLAGDFNSHAEDFGYPTTDPRGREVVDFIACNGLILHNVPDSLPTFETQMGKGWPDITLSTARLAQKIQHWTVSDTPSNSDHRYITFQIGQPHAQFMNKRYRTNGRKLKQLVSRLLPVLEQVDEALMKCQNIKDADDLTTSMIRDIQSICDATLGLKSPKVLRVANWWTKELRAQRSRTRALRRKMKSERDPDRRQALSVLYNKEQAQYKRAIAAAKLASWREFCTKNVEVYGALHKIASNKVYRPPELRAFAGQQAGHITEITLRTILDAVLPEEDITDPSDHQAYTLHTSVPDDMPFTEKEVSATIKILPKSKAPGPDSIDYPILRAIHKARSGFLTRYFNKLLALQSFPEPYKTGQVVLFKKEGKDPNSPSSFRPICLLPVIGKLYEKLLVQRLKFHMTQSGAISDAQYGFRELRSTIAALSKIRDYISHLHERKQHAAVLSLDLQSAFDSLWWPSILEALHQARIPDNLLQVFKQYLSNRKFIVTHTGGVITRSQTKGCPQGSCAGPDLWNATFDSILRYEWPSHTQIVAFADDATFVVGGKSRDELQQNCNDVIDTFSRLCQEKKLIISEAKSKYIIYHKPGQTLIRNPTIQLNGKTIKRVRELKLLGIILDEKFTWLPHLKAQREKARRIANNLQKMQGPHWGLRPNIYKILYSTVAERVLTYGAAIWAAPMTVRKAKLLSSAQRPFVLAITKTYRTTSTAAASVLAGLMPLPIKAQQEASIAKVTQLQQPCTYGDTCYLPEVYETRRSKLSTHPSEYGLGIRTFHSPALTPRLDGPGAVLYTDGSKIDNAVGSAYIAYINGNIAKEWKGRLGAQNSVFQAEVVALTKAVKWAIDTRQSRATIFTDSLSSIYAINNPLQRSALISHLQEVLRLQEKSMRIQISWVKAHAGIQGNEAADALAKKAAQNEETEQIQVPLPRSCLKRQIEESAIGNWQNEWDQIPQGRRAYEFLPKVEVDRLISSPYLTRYITGHGPFPTYFAERGLATTDMCVCGNVGSPDHYVTECPLTAEWHIKFPTTNVLPFKRLLIKHRGTRQKLKCIMAKLEKMGIDLCRPE